MKITRKDLLEWISQKTPVRYHETIYRAHYNGLRYFLAAEGKDSIDFFYDKKDRRFRLVKALIHTLATCGAVEGV